MAHYNSLKSLGENILKQDDLVEFMGIIYKVNMRYLFNKNNIGYNEEIFHRLHIKDIHTFCSDHYGYIASRGAWPEYRVYDFSAATRLVKALFEIIESEKAVKDSKKEAIDTPLKEESRLSVLLPSKPRNIKQIEIQKEITFNKL